MNQMSRQRGRWWTGLAAAAAVIASSILVLVPAAAQAKRGVVRSCALHDRSSVLSVRAKGVSCQRAREIERYAAHHDWSAPFRLHGRRWRATVYSHAHHHTYLRFRSGRLTVWITVKAATKGGAPRGSGAAPQLAPLSAVTYAPQASVPVSGHGVAAGQYVIVGGRASEIEADSDGQLGFVLPPDVSAGRLPVQLAAPPTPGGPPMPIRGSAPRVLMVRPNLVDIRLVSNGAAVRAQVMPAVHPTQQVALTLIGPSTSAQLSSTTTTSSQTLDFPLPTPLPAGTYLGMIEVDGVSSLLPECEDGVCTDPTVTYP